MDKYVESAVSGTCIVFNATVDESRISERHVGCAVYVSTRYVKLEASVTVHLIMNRNMVNEMKYV